jgi:hypothetical protein
MFESISPPTRPNWILRIVILALSVAVATGFVSLWRMTQMPLSPYKGPLPPLTRCSRKLLAAFQDTSGISQRRSARETCILRDLSKPSLTIFSKTSSTPVTPLQNSRIASRGTWWPISKHSFLEAAARVRGTKRSRNWTQVAPSPRDRSYSD